jgi:hypothetical protein
LVFPSVAPIARPSLDTRGFRGQMRVGKSGSSLFCKTVWEYGPLSCLAQFRGHSADASTTPTGTPRATLGSRRHEWRARRPVRTKLTRSGEAETQARASRSGTPA